MRNLFLLLILIFISGCDVVDNNPANELTTVHLLDAYIDTEHLANLYSNKLTGLEVPVRIFNDNKELKGTTEAQGSGSRYLPKWSFEVKLDKGSVLDLSNFNLSAQVGDHSMLRTKLASYIYKRMGFPVFDSDYAFLKINGKNKGLYLIIERVESDFFKRRMIPIYEVIKTMFGAKFTLRNGTNLYEYFEKEINDNDNLYNFENFILALDNTNEENIFPELAEHLDIDSYLKYHAVSTVIAAKDGFRNNIIFYKETPGSPYKTLPWDFDGSFNPTFTPLHYGDNEIINKLLQNDSCLTIYNKYFNECLDMFSESNIFPLIDETVNRISEAYNLDPYLGEAGYNLKIEAEELKNFITDRRNKLLTKQ